MNTTTKSDPLAELRSTATISITRAAEILGVSRGLGYQMARDGRLPVIELGPRRMRVKSAGLLAMLESDSVA
ncbi:excisionase family DNA-binding protein [Nocardia nova]|uniref:excisionase family DNA-binding protein n=1 Tax=Nocardia nova TaxID=37330 RepID=UPI002739A323|nr:excisionase family DNA-binding protein [Nocardia nova]